MSKFDAMIAAGPEVDLDELTASIYKRMEDNFRTGAYTEQSRGRDWVNLVFKGEVTEGEMFPLAYMELNKYLRGLGYKQSQTIWGSRRFEKSNVSSDASYGLAADADYLRLTVGLGKKSTTVSDVLSQPRFFQHPFLEVTLKGLNLLPPASFIPRWQ
ncbi:hypothetical protein O9K51_10315 [Purpureocillium lavendulum]|nr:hypothetical protein O9K51_10315 [Purpureocillium lavendulum]